MPPLLVVLLLLSVFAGAARATALPLKGEGIVRIAHPLGDSFLLKSDRCVTRCPLVVVSHSRGMTAERSMERPWLREMFGAFNAAGMAVLVSNDAGPKTWGERTVMQYLQEVHARAVYLFPYNGSTYTLGYSMGGLPALLSAYQKVFPVSGVMLIDARVNLLDAWQSWDAPRRQEIALAHGVNERDPLPLGADPLNDYSEAEVGHLPVLVVGSAEDDVVPFHRNGELLMQRHRAPESRLVRVSGPHLGASHVGPDVSRELVTFVQRVEQVRALQANRP